MNRRFPPPNTFGDIPFNYNSGAVFAPTKQSDLGELSPNQWLLLGAAAVAAMILLGGSE
jgi:hypothetical protein